MVKRDFKHDKQLLKRAYLQISSQELLNIWFNYMKSAHIIHGLFLTFSTILPVFSGSWDMYH